MASVRRYRIPAERVRVEDRIDRSRFITTLEAVASVDEAKQVIARVRAEFPDATHHAFAYVIGPPGNTALATASDDGEPSGTAGRPMLKVLLNCGLGDVVSVVTRYYGGIKLGAGGLVRAYSAGVQRALRDVAVREHVDEIGARLAVSYTAIDAVRRALAREEARVVDESYGAEITLVLRIPADRIDALERALADATGGVARIER